MAKTKQPPDGKGKPNGADPAAEPEGDEPGEVGTQEAEPAQAGVDWTKYLDDDSGSEDGPQDEAVESPPASASGEDSGEDDPDTAEAGASETGTAEGGDEPEPAEDPSEEEPESESESEPSKAAAPAEPKVPDAPKAPTEEELQAQRKRARDRVRDRFKMTAEQGDDLIQNIQDRLPEVLADMYFTVMDDVYAGMQAHLPGAIQQTLRAQEGERKLEQDFFGKWPKLRGHEDTVRRLAQTYRQVNPGATVEQAIQEVGAQAHVALRLPLEDAPPPTKKPAAHQPERAGRPVTPAKRSRPANAYEQMAEDFLAEDQA